MTIIEMSSGQTLSEHIALRCDATPAIGVGHVVRCLALAEELRARGCAVVLWGRIDGLDWLSELVDASGLTRISPADDIAGMVRQASESDWDAVVLDGYELPVPLGGALRSHGLTVLALVDGGFGAAQEADVYVDQNLGATAHRGGPVDSVALAGPDFTLLRDAVLRRRRSPGQGDEIRSVLAVFGGSDPAGAAPVVVPALLATGAAVDVTVVSANPETADRLAAQRLGSQQRLRVIPPQAELAELAATSDLAITAAGTTVWELLAMGVPTAAVCVVDNQRLGYRALLAADVATGLGELSSFDSAAATRALASIIESPSRATDLAIRGQQLIDGGGRRRVTDALLDACAKQSPAR